MLVEIRCEAFKSHGQIRPPIEFHPGLNVVLGTSRAANSIGKSTFLAVLDFVFGGDDYATKIHDAVDHVNEHVIKYAFLFGGVRHCFTRGTATYKTVEYCTEDYRPLEKWSIQHYQEFLAHQYGMANADLTFRGMVSRFIRVYHRENHNELRPLDSHPKEKGAAVIDFLLKAFGRFQELSEAKKQADIAQESYKVFRQGVAYGHIPSVPTKKEAAELEKRLQELRGLQESTERIAYLQGKSAEEAMHIVETKKNLQIARAKRSRLAEKYERLKSQEIVADGRFAADFREVKRLFPGISLKRLDEIESFHRGLTDILSKEIQEEIAITHLELTNVSKEIAALESVLGTEPGMSDIPRRVFKEYAECEKEINTIEEKLEKRSKEETLKSNSREYWARYKSRSKDILSAIQANINEKMSELDAMIYNGTKQPPRLLLEPTKYVFHTLNDAGTGTAYKSMLVLDLAFMELTSLPIIVHDSLLLKNIGDEPLSKLIQLYQKQTPKQVFLAFDKADSYDNQTRDTLERCAVLRLSDDEGALFGRDWSKKDATGTENSRDEP